MDENQAPGMPRYVLLDPSRWVPVLKDVLNQLVGEGGDLSGRETAGLVVPAEWRGEVVELLGDGDGLAILIPVSVTSDPDSIPDPPGAPGDLGVVATWDGRLETWPVLWIRDRRTSRTVDRLDLFLKASQGSA